MKLHHFISAKVTDDVQRIQSVGRALAPEATPIPVFVEPVVVDEASKKPVEAKKEDETDDMHDFAVAQLEKSTCHSAHHKIKHYD